MSESSSKHSARNDSGEIATSTLAEIYAQQGLLGRALSIYRRMLARSPEDAGIADRIRNLEVRMAETGPEPQPEPASDSPAVRERLPWDPPEREDAAPVDPTATPGDTAGEPGSVTFDTESERAPVESPRVAGRMDAEAFRSWLEGR